MLNNSQLIIEHINSSVMSSRSSKLRELISIFSRQISQKLESGWLSSVKTNPTTPVSASTPIIESKTSAQEASYQPMKEAAPDLTVNTDNINIFRIIYESFQNILYPLGGINSENDFIFSLFNTADPFNGAEFKSSIRLQLSTQYVYTLSYSGTDSNCIYPMAFFYMTRKVYKLLNPTENNNTSNVNYYLLPESLTNIDQLTSIMYLLNSDIIIIVNSLYYMMSSMGFADSSKFDLLQLPKRWPIQTIDTISILLSNIFIKLFYSIFVIINSLDKGIVPFSFKIFENKTKFIIYQDRATIFSPRSTTNNIFSNLFSNPIFITASSVVFDKTRSSTIPFSSAASLSWRDVFKSLDGVKINSINISFIKPYVIQMDIPTFVNFISNYLNKIFIIRQDMICIAGNYAYLILNDVLYARPSALNTIQCLPGNDLKICSQSYLNNLHTAYNVDASTFNLYKKHGSNYYDISTFEMITDAFAIYSKYLNNTCNTIINTKNFSIMHQYMYTYLMFKHIQNGNIFENNTFNVNNEQKRASQISSLIRSSQTSWSSILNNIYTSVVQQASSNSDLSFSPNLDLLTFSIALNTMTQNQIQMKDATTIDVYKPNLDYMLKKIENECTQQFNQLADKNLLDHNCRCLYRDGTNDLSPYCFDPQCRNSIDNPSTIYKKYECKYPTCSQSFDITNVFSSSLNLNNISSQFNCGAVSSSNVIKAPAKYKIYFSQDKRWWSINTTSNLLVASLDRKDASIFEVLIENDILYINNLDLYNSYIIYKKGSKIPILIGIFTNQLYVKHKVLNSLIFYEEPVYFIVSKYTDISSKYTVTFILS